MIVVRTTAEREAGLAWDAFAAAQSVNPSPVEY